MRAEAQIESQVSSEGEAVTGSVHGSVLDGERSPVSGALILMRFANGNAERAVLSGPDGSFDFPHVHAGAFTLQVSSDRFMTRTLSGTVKVGESLQIPQIALALTAGPADAQVFATLHDVAAAQVKMQEQQRVLGVFPNFYISYVLNPVPLSRKQKFSLAWRSTLDPVNLALTGAVAGFEQSSDEYTGYGQGAAGYGKRYGASFADGAISTMLGGAALPILFRQDPRYFWKGTGSVRVRVAYAVSRVVVCKGDNGRWQPNYSAVLGNLGAAGISNLYYPSSDRDGVGLTVSNALIGTASGALSNLYQEFFSRGMTPRARKMAAEEAASRK